MTKQNNHGWNLTQSYAQLPSIFYTKINPTAVADPRFVIFNQKLESDLGLSGLNSEQGEKMLAGNTLPPDSVPIAQAYAGHQFGGFTRLGDGRAILLGEQETPHGGKVDIQLKGAGRTPYSRGGDGRGSLGPMLREYIISEAMHSLEIPTSRALAVTKTGDPVIREDILQGAILTRISSSHLRVGTFEYALTWGKKEDLKALADYTIERHDSEVGHDNPYVGLLENVIDRQAYLIAQWQLVGFIHGVMNTDNMTISGETIDYGPCAFMDTYDRQTVFSSIDHQGRYAYGNQPYIGGWNLARFAESLLPLLHDDQDQAVEIAQKALSAYEQQFQSYYEAGMRAKLGLFTKQETDSKLITDLLNLLEKYEADYTNTFIDLTFDQITDNGLADQADFTKWYKRWKKRIEDEEKSDEEVTQRMRNNNPAVIPRNHRVEEALEAAVKHDDFNVMHDLLDVLTQPYAHTSEQTKYAVVPESTVPYKTFCGT